MYYIQRKEVQQTYQKLYNSSDIFIMLCVGGGLSTQGSIANENTFQNWKRNAFIRQTKIEKANYQLTCTIRNVKWIPSGKRNIISDRNFNLHKEIKNARNCKNEKFYTERSKIYYM